MSTGTLKKPSRPPPPPPIHDSYSFNISHNNHHPSNSSSSSSSATFAGNCRKSNSRLSDYIKISECHTGLPDRHQQLGSNPFDNKYNTSVGLAGFKNRTSTSFSSATLKPSTNLFSLGRSSPLANHNQHPQHGQTYQSSHQKSHSLTENHLNPSFYDLPPYEAQHNNRGNKHHSSTRHSNHMSGSGNNHIDKTSGCGQSYFKHEQVDDRKSASYMSPATVYKTVDFAKTEALTKCIDERSSGRGSDFNRLLVSSSSLRKS